MQHGAVSSSAVQGEQEARTLEPGKPIERELAGGAVHAYRIMLAAGQYLHVSVEQRGIDMVVALRGPDGVPLMEMDGLRGMLGIEELSWEAANTGWYVLEVRAKVPAADNARYEVSVQKAAAATRRDLARVAAERLFMEAIRAEASARGAGTESAVRKYGEAVEQWRAAGDRKWEGQTLHNLGSIYQRLSQHEKAKDHYEQALAIRRETRDRLGEGTALNGLGNIYWSLSQNEKAREYYEQALAIGREIKNRDGEGTALHNLGNIYRNLSQSEKARAHYEQALAIRRALKNREGEASTLNGLGNVYLDLSQHEKAREYYEQALAIRRELKDRNGEGQALHNLGIVYRNLNQNEKARVHYEQALAIWRVTKNRQGEGQALNNLGVLYRSLSQNEKAREYYEQSLAIRREIKDRSGEGYALNNLGEVYHSLRQYEKAREYYEQSLAIWRETKSRGGEGSVLNNLGSVYLKLGQYEKAREYYEQSLAIRREIANRYGEGQVLNNLGETYWRLGQHEKVRAYFEQALAIWREIKDKEGEGYALNNIGSVYRLFSQHEKAKEHYEQALTIRRDIGDGSGEADTLLNLASLERDRGDLSAALKRIESALAVIETLRTAYTNLELRAVYSSAVQDFYEFYIDLLMRLHKQRPSAGHDAAALQVSERSRARALLETLAEAGADIRQGVEPQLVESERSLQQQLNLKAQLQLKLLSGTHTEKQAAAIAKEIEDLTTEYQTVKARIRRNSPRYATLTQPVSLGLKEIQQLLDPETLLLEYALGEERSYLWAVSGTAMTSYELPKRAEIERLARRVYESFSTSNATAGDGYSEAVSGLSRMLLGPVAAQLGKKRLLVVSEGYLQYLPFAALPAPRVTGGTSRVSGSRKASRPAYASHAPPLIVEHEIVNLPSASLLAVLRRELSGRAPAPKMIAVLADPVFDRNDLRVKAEAGRQVSEVKNSENKLQDSKPSSALQVPAELERSARDAGGLNFDRLRSSRDEAEEIVGLARGGESLKALDFDASRETALSEELGRYRVVHFATHGLLNSLHPELSGLVLSLVNEGGQPQDGFLRAHEVYNLKLGADLVVLSACQTALGKEVRGEGLIGLTRGFMYAGSPRVVASLWRVPSKATAELMKRFYRGMLVEGLRPAAALRAAQVGMWREKRWNEPYYWSAFVLQGEWQ
jgi:CHAT domain-containing protein/Tfp pilus assembly protein PilF